MLEVFLPVTMSYVQATDEETPQVLEQSLPTLIFSFIVSLYAAYLSWNCNTARGISAPMKGLYAFFAFVFGGLYLILYFMFNYGYCGPTVPVAQFVP